MTAIDNTTLTKETFRLSIIGIVLTGIIPLLVGGFFIQRFRSLFVISQTELDMSFLDLFLYGLQMLDSFDVFLTVFAVTCIIVVLSRHYFHWAGLVLLFPLIIAGTNMLGKREAVSLFNDIMSGRANFTQASKVFGSPEDEKYYKICSEEGRLRHIIRTKTMNYQFCISRYQKGQNGVVIALDNSGQIMYTTHIGE